MSLIETKQVYFGKSCQIIYVILGQSMGLEVDADDIKDLFKTIVLN